MYWVGDKVNTLHLKIDLYLEYKSKNLSFWELTNFLSDHKDYIIGLSDNDPFYLKLKEIDTSLRGSPGYLFK